MRVTRVRGEDRTPGCMGAAGTCGGHRIDRRSDGPNAAPGATGRSAPLVGGTVRTGSERFGGAGCVARRPVYGICMVGCESGGVRVSGGGAAVVGGHQEPAAAIASPGGGLISRTLV